MARKNNKFDYENISLSEINYETRVKNEIERGNEISAFLLVHSYLDAFMRDWIFYCGENQQSQLKENTLDDIDRISFYDLMHIHLAMGNINFTLFKRLKNFNKLRNEFAHSIMSVNLVSNKTKKELIRQTNEGVELCKIIFELYKKSLDKKLKTQWFKLNSGRLGESKLG